ncbi:hypothetical protein T12_8408 [Trichinella patagoniensis]|uniref:CCHC-type domain-containing protein n=1 Tax=Trichinella patagoniensis TaxID=990121 RepID=A0A0V0Z695_9BILA|nr:hypothetical protein T12_8408 [Trichinella patagoniensis]
MYFRAADVPSEHRAALVQYYTDAGVRNALTAWEVNDVKVCPSVSRAVIRTAAPEGIPPPEGAANSVLLLQFKSGRCLDAVKLLIYHAIWSAWKSGGNCQTRRAGGELDHQAHRKNIFGSHSDAETSVGNEAERTPDRRDPCDYNKNGSTACRQARSGHKNCWSCGRVGHFSQDCEMCNGRGRVSGELQLRTLPVVVIKSPVTEIS